MQIVLLAQDIIAFAAAAVPMIILNQGAQLLAQGNHVTMSYPSQNAFEEEIIWHIWHHSRPT
ncbi:MAG: hypothetical protein QF785_14065 [Phycisphaeraceae bacterium]|jgi:hypothetical protein|nr:hypothetical protein [Phycisphaeraceae bacterium]